MLTGFVPPSSYMARANGNYTVRLFQRHRALGLPGQSQQWKSLHFTGTTFTPSPKKLHRKSLTYLKAPPQNKRPSAQQERKIMRHQPEYSHHHPGPLALFIQQSPPLTGTIWQPAISGFGVFSNCTLSVNSRPYSAPSLRERQEGKDALAVTAQD